MAFRPLLLAAVVLPSFVACSGDDGGDTNVVAEGTHYHYVVNTVLVPETNTQAREFGIDLDGNGTTDNAPYRGGKLTNFEGGIKVPFVMKWKGHIEPGTVYNHPVISLDIFATIASAIGIELPSDRKYDGVNLLPYVNGKKRGAAHEALYWRSDFNKAIRKDDWKLIINEHDNTQQLYNLKEDSTERKNLYAQKRDEAKTLLKDLNTWEEELIKPLWPRVVNYDYRDTSGKHVFAF